MNEILSSKADLWSDWISSFQESGLSRKEWCQQNEIPLSTFSYWSRKFQTVSPVTESSNEPVFARLPSEQELCSGELAGLVKQQLLSGGAWNIVSYSVDGTGDTWQPYSMSTAAYVMIPDESTVEKAKELMRQVREGETLSQE